MRPVRAARLETENVPKPISVRESPLLRAFSTLDVKDFKKDPLILDDPFWVTKVYYYEDTILESDEEESWDCDQCGGSGWQYEECNQTGNDGGGDDCVCTGEWNPVCGINGFIFSTTSFNSARHHWS